MRLFLFCVLFAPDLQVIVGVLTSPGPPEADLLNRYANVCRKHLQIGAKLSGRRASLAASIEELNTSLLKGGSGSEGRRLFRCLLAAH